MLLSARFLIEECMENAVIHGDFPADRCCFFGGAFLLPDIPLQNDMLYLLPDPSVPAELPSSCVCILHESDCTKTTWKNCISVPDSCDFLLLFSKMQALFNAFSHWYKELYEACILGCNLQELVNITEKMTPNHIYISDMSFKILAYTDKEIMTAISSTWNYQKKYGYYPLRIIKNLIDTGDMEKMKHCRHPILFHSPNFALPFTCKNIYFANKPQAHLFIVNCTVRPCARDYVIVDQLADFINRYYYLLSDARPNTTEKYYEAFMDDVISGVITDPDIIEEQIRSLGWSLPFEYCMAVLDIANHDKAFWQLIRYYIEKNCGYEYFASGDFLVILIPSKEQAALKKILQTLSSSYSLPICLGNSFQGFLHLPDQYTILTRTSRIARKYDPQQLFIEMKDFGLYYLLDYMLSSPHLQQICSPEIQTLKTYDTLHDTAYIHTLYMYLTNECNVVKTAAALHIHRNTLMYRMNKIHDLISFDEASSLQRLQLHLSLLVLRHEELLDN